MFRKSLSVWLFTLVLLGLVVCSDLSPGAAAPTATLQTQRLTDRDNSLYYVLSEPATAAGKNSVHVAWHEFTFVDPPDTFDPGLFYTRLPSGQVKQLSESAGNASEHEVKMVLDSNDNAHLIWSEDTESSEGWDLFYWKSGMATSLRLSDHTQSNGDIGGYFIVLDNNNRPHVLWAEGTVTVWAAPRVFYWTEGSNVTELSIGDFSTAGFNVTNAVGLVEADGVVHALWRDLDTSTPGGVEPFYWNSDDQIVMNLRDAGKPGSDGFVCDYSLDKDGTFHVLWSDILDGPANLEEFSHWDSDSQTNQIIASHDYNSGLDLISAKDGDGQLHVVLEGDSGRYHWDSKNQSTSLVPNLNERPSLLDGVTGDFVHLLWTWSDARFPGHLEDVFYWRPGMAQALNISDHSGALADAEVSDFVVDETDVAHVYWSEGNLFYFNTAISSTVALTTTLPTTGRSDTDGASYGDVMAASGGVGYVLVPTGQTETPFMVWQSDTYTYTQVSAVYEPAGVPEKYMLWLDSNDQAQVAWLDQGPAGEGNNLHYWNAADGSQDLTDNGDTDGDCDDIWINALADGSGRVYLLWNEDGIGDDDETDLYAAYLPIEYTDFVYLPLVLNGSGQ